MIGFCNSREIELIVDQQLDSTHGMPSQKVARAYKEAVESRRNGEVLDVRDFA
jgi:hypothetical protein